MLRLSGVRWRLLGRLAFRCALPLNSVSAVSFDGVYKLRLVQNHDTDEEVIHRRSEAQSMRLSVVMASLRSAAECDERSFAERSSRQRH